MTEKADIGVTTWPNEDEPEVVLFDDEVTEYPDGDVLPTVWVSEALINDAGKVIGRSTPSVYPDPKYPDTGGNNALWYGAGYYEEAMTYTDPADRHKRIEAFRMAEIMYRHAAGLGNAIAHLNLGYVYSYDRCEGRYWADPRFNWSEAGGAREQPYPRKERAFACLAFAAEAGIPEACYKLGDMYKRGTGCEPDAGAAFRWYKRASELAARESPVILGSIALRLGECYEEGFGCEQDFAQALRWYQRSVEGLEAAVEAGERWYAKALASARAGVKRCQQEVACG